MSKDIQSKPLAPAGIHGRSDEEFGVFRHVESKQQRSSKCPVYMLAGIVILSAVILVFGLAVLRVETPEFELRSVAVKNLRHGTTPSASFNVTLTAEISVENKNFGAFNFENGTASFLYEGMVVGDRKFNNSQVQARKTKRMTLAFQVRSSRLSDDMNLTSDINSGTLNFTAYAEVTGRVRVLEIVRRRKTAKMNCSLSLNLQNSSIYNIVC